ncbi:MAG: L,D-transpeptidase family protein [Thermomicrobiales bacterium]
MDETQRLPGITPRRARAGARPSSRSRRQAKRRPGLSRRGMAIGAGLVAMVAVAALLASGRLVLPAALAGLDMPRIGQSEDTAASWSAEVATDVLNVRDSASLEASVLATLGTGARVTVTGGEVDGFVPVRTTIDGAQRRGWVAVAYLQPIDGAGWATDPNHGAALDDLAVADDPVAGSSGSDDDPAVVAPEPTQEPTAIPTAAPTQEPAVAPTAVPTGERWIDVDRTTATVTLYIGETPVEQFSALIGRDPSPDGFYSTAVGTFHVYSMDAALSATPFVDDVYLTDWVGFDPERKNGFHSPVRNVDGSVRVTGGTVTMGCVRLGEDDARTLYAFAEIGMRVEIHD